MFFVSFAIHASNALGKFLATFIASNNIIQSAIMMLSIDEMGYNEMSSASDFGIL